jgi:class 3 adenylate cyclase
MQQITDRLNKLGISESADRIVENRIDLSILPDVTDQEPKDLGVALCAVEAGLAIVEVVPGLSSSTSSPPQVRVSVRTGDGLVGDLMGTGAAPEHAVVSETPNLGAGLQGVVESNSVIIVDSTCTLLDSRVELEDLGPRTPRASPDGRSPGPRFGRAQSASRCGP